MDSIIDSYPCQVSNSCWRIYLSTRSPVLLTPRHDKPILTLRRRSVKKGLCAKPMDQLPGQLQALSPNRQRRILLSTLKLKRLQPSQARHSEWRGVSSARLLGWSCRLSLEMRKKKKKKWPLIIEYVEEVDFTSGNRKDWLRPSKLGLQQKNKRQVVKKAHPLSLLPHLRRHWFCRLRPLTRQRVWKAFHSMGYRKRSPYKVTTPCPVHNLRQLRMLIHLVRKNWTFFWSASLHSSIWSFHRLTLINSSRH